VESANNPQTPAARANADAEPAPDRRVQVQDKPIVLLVLLATVVAVIEFGVMLLAARLSFSTVYAIALFDALATVALLPLLFVLLVRPLVSQINRRKQTENALRASIREQNQAAAEIQRLRGLLPICASCKRIRGADGYWIQIEQYVEANSEASFTHGICPDCARALYPRVGNRSHD
jgi:uncharacterized membrane protein (UPF0182 family)